MLPPQWAIKEPQRTCDTCYSILAPEQEGWIKGNANAERENFLEDDSTTKYLNSPLRFTLGGEIRKASYAIQNLTDRDNVNYWGRDAEDAMQPSPGQSNRDADNVAMLLTPLDVAEDRPAPRVNNYWDDRVRGHPVPSGRAPPSPWGVTFYFNEVTFGGGERRLYITKQISPSNQANIRWTDRQQPRGPLLII